VKLDEQTRGDFPILQRIVSGHPLVYLDSGASSQKPRAVIEAMSEYYERSHANVHRSIHTLGEEATELYELARDAVQRFIGATSREEVVFTRGTTDGLGLIAETIGRTLKRGDEIVVTELEHHSNLIPWQLVARDRGAVIKAVPILADGMLDLAALDRLLTARTSAFESLDISRLAAEGDFALRFGAQQFHPKQVCISCGRGRRQINPATSIVRIFVQNDAHQPDSGGLREYGWAGISADGFRPSRNGVDSQIGRGPGAIEALGEVEHRVGANRCIIVNSCIKVPKIDDPLRRRFARARREKLLPIFRRFGS